MITIFKATDEASFDCEEYICSCNACGYEFVLVNMNEDGFTWTDEKPNFCPNCATHAE